MNPRVMLVISIIAMACMLFFGARLFLAGKGIMYIIVPLGMIAFMLYGYINSTRNNNK